jgi:hypothetical protein
MGIWTSRRICSELSAFILGSAIGNPLSTDYRRVGISGKGWVVFRGGCFQAGVFDTQSLQRPRTSRAAELRDGRNFVAASALTHTVRRKRVDREQIYR